MYVGPSAPTDKLSIARLRPEIRKGSLVRSRGYALSLRERGQCSVFIVTSTVFPLVRRRRRKKKRRRKYRKNRKGVRVKKKGQKIKKFSFHRE